MGSPRESAASSTPKACGEVYQFVIDEQAAIREKASTCGCHPDAQRKDLQLHSFATARPSDEVQDADLHEGSYFTFVMASRSHTLYVGVTGNLRKRVFEHKD
jgi:hypothetical protein